MKAALLPDLLTPCTALEAAHALRAAWPCSSETLALALAQAALETGRFRSMHCWNFGNVKAAPAYEGSYCQFRCNEVLDGVVQWFDPPHPQTNFRAFRTIDEGAAAWLAALRLHFPLAWEALPEGQPLAFVHALKLGRYFTADEAPYARAVASLWKEFTRLLEGEPGSVPPAPLDAGLHAEALAAKQNYDWADDAREERNAALREP